MKELNEYKAEIFRRSEKRIQARKAARRRIIAACVPLCLCLVVIGMALPRLMPIGTDHAHPESGDSSGGITSPQYGSAVDGGVTIGGVTVGGVTSSMHSRATVSCGDTVIAVKQPDKLYDTIVALFTFGSTNGSSDHSSDGSSNETYPEGPESTTGDSAPPIYYLHFTRPDGTTVFLLQGNTLIYEHLGIRITVTDEQAAALQRGDIPSL